MHSVVPEGLKFLIVGGANTVVSFGLYITLLWLGLNFNVALLIAYIFGILFGYCANRYWTFTAPKYQSENSRSRSIKRYILSYALTFLVNLLLLNLAVEVLGLSPILGQGASLLLTTLSSYLLQRNWVFR